MDSYFSKSSFRCGKGFVIAEKAEEETFSLYSDSAGREEWVVCSDMSKMRASSVQYRKLEVLCRDRTIKVTGFQVLILLITIAMFSVAGGICYYTTKLKPSELTQ